MAEVPQNPDLVAIAREYGFPVTDSTSNQELAEMLAPTPPTAAQLFYLHVLTGRRDLTITTFAQAMATIEVLEDLRNESALQRAGWSVGDVLAWNAHHWLIEQIHDSSFGHRICLRKVEFGIRDGHAVVVMLAKTATRWPYSLELDGACKVALDILPALVAPKA